MVAHQTQVAIVGSGLAGLSLAEVMMLQKVCAAETRKSDDINCIFIFAVGGMPQQDMWDLKPTGPAETRGDFSPISTNVPGTGHSSTWTVP